MSDPIVKGVKRSPSRPTSRHTSTVSSSKNRSLAGKSAKPKPMVKRSSADKAPARKATNSDKPVSTKNKQAKTAQAARKRPTAPASKKAAPARTPTRKATTPAKPQKKTAPTTAAKPKVAQKKTAKPVSVQQQRRPAAPPPAPTPPRQPTRDEAAALKAFEKAHKEFVRGRFSDARALFRALVEKHAGVSEVTARARTYLAIAEARLRTESTLPRDADSLYDRGVIELNRGEYVAAQEMFERALKREPEAAHIHYGLAATRARLGAIDSALESLGRALDLQPNLRVRAQHDQDLTILRNDPDFERLVFTPRF